MKLRIKKYLSSPLGIYFRIRRDLPCLLRGTTFYKDLEKRQPPTPIHAERNDKHIIDDYWSYHSKRSSKSVVYTCITNGYDDLNLIANHAYVNRDWDYVCFTDDRDQIEQQRIGIWQIKPLAFTKLDDTRNNRWHKMHPHILFPSHTESIYVDANIDILSPFIFEIIRAKDEAFVLPQHSVRTCIFKEYELFLSEFSEETSRITAEWHLLKKSGMPKNFGLTENNILYRRHLDTNIIELMNDWWGMVADYSRRDQLSLMYLIWKRELDLSRMTFPNARRLPNDFCVFKHTPKAIGK